MADITISEIEKVLDEKVRPSLHADGGDIHIVSFQGGILEVRMSGRCNNCPSAMATMENVVEAEVREAFPSIKDIRLLTGVSDETIEMAKAILLRRHANDN